MWMQEYTNSVKEHHGDTCLCPKSVGLRTRRDFCLDSRRTLSSAYPPKPWLPMYVVSLSARNEERELVRLRRCSNVELSLSSCCVEPHTHGTHFVFRLHASQSSGGSGGSDSDDYHGAGSARSIAAAVPVQLVCLVGPRLALPRDGHGKITVSVAVAATVPLPISLVVVSAHDRSTHMFWWMCDSSASKGAVRRLVVP